MFCFEIPGRTWVGLDSFCRKVGIQWRYLRDRNRLECFCVLKAHIFVPLFCWFSFWIHFKLLKRLFRRLLSFFEFLSMIKIHFWILLEKSVLKDSSKVTLSPMIFLWDYEFFLAHSHICKAQFLQAPSFILFWYFDKLISSDLLSCFQNRELFQLIFVNW